MSKRKLVLIAIGVIIFAVTIMAYLHFSKTDRDEKQENQQAMHQTQTIQKADTEMESEEINEAGDALE